MTNRYITIFCIDALKLKNTREEKNLSTYELAELSRMSQAQVSRLESGKRKRVFKENLDRLSKALGVEPEYLIRSKHQMCDGSVAPEQKKKSFGKFSKEYTLSASIVLQEQYLLANILEIEYISSSHLEFPIKKLNNSLDHKNIDIYGNTDTGEDFAIEVQLNGSDKEHLDKVKYLIRYFERAKVIWFASSFSDEHIREIQRYILKNEKWDIELYLVQISSNLLDVLENFRYLNVVNIKENLYLLKSIEDRFKVVRKISFGEKISFEKNLLLPEKTLSHTEIRNLNILKKLRTCSSNLNVHRYKSNLDKRRVCFGGGREGVIISYGIFGEEYSVEYKFKNGDVPIFDELLELEEELKTKLDETIIFDKGAKIITVYPKNPEEDLEKQDDWIVSTIEKLFRYTANTIYYGGTDSVNVKNNLGGNLELVLLEHH